MRFANDFHSWLRHSWKLLANRLTRDPKIVIHGNSCIILYIITGHPIYDNSPVSQLFLPWWWAPRTTYISSEVRTAAGCIAIFQKYCCYIKHGSIITNLTLWNPWGILLICQNTTMWVYGAWIRMYYVLCSKTYSTSRNLFKLIASSRQPLGVLTFVRLAY